MSKLAVVRIKGSADVSEEAEDTFRMLNLNRPNHCVVVEDNPSTRGMLQKLKEKATWGEVNSETLEKMIAKRGQLEGGEPVLDKDIQGSTSYDSIGEFAEAVCEGESDLDEMESLKGVFRLHPPRKGYGSTRRSYHHGGSAGDREEAINDLILRMI